MPGYKQRRKVIIAGRYIRAVQYTMHCDQESRKSRAPKELVSSCAREAINLRHSWEKLKMLMAANFDFPDLVVTLTYADDARPPRETSSSLSATCAPSAGRRDNRSNISMSRSAATRSAATIITSLSTRPAQTIRQSAACGCTATTSTFPKSQTRAMTAGRAI